MNRNVQELNPNQKLQIKWLVIERLREHGLLTVWGVTTAMNSKVSDLTDLIEVEILENIIGENK